jgi:hypothetical protein
MRSLHKIALFVGLAAVVGCGDDPDQSLNGVYPTSGFIGRKVRVEVSADNASFVDGSVTVDFGAGVTVDKVSVASPTAVFAEITISDAAPLGLRDVTVRQDGDVLTLRQAFALESPLAFTTQGSLAQGSIVAFTARNLDFSSPFDTTCGTSFFGICLEYTGMQMTVPDGMNAVINSVDSYTVSGTLYVDLDATSGPIRFASGPADDASKQIVSAVGVDTEVEARTAVALTAGSPTTTTVAAAFDSHLYEFTADASSLARFSASPGDTDAEPAIYILPESGRFFDMIAASAKPSAVSETGGKYYAIYADGSGTYGYSYAMRVSPLALMKVAESDNGGANNTSAQAQNVGANTSILLTNATIASADDVDWIRFTVPANSGSKRVRVMTAGGDPLTDTYVEVYKDAEATDKLIGEGDDRGYHEDVVTSPIGATASNVIFVKISGSPGYFKPAHNQYVAAIWLE